jgi:very-short-patch-repair endonuclease
LCASRNDRPFRDRDLRPAEGDEADLGTIIGANGTGAHQPSSVPAMPIDLRQPFRGTDAVAAGLVTPKALRGPRLRRLFTGIYIRADVEITLDVRSRAAYLLLDGRGVLGGFSAAELLEASCGPLDAPAEVVVASGGVTPRPGLLVRHDELAPDEVTEVSGCTATSPLRTAYDLARRLPLVEAVVAVDALAYAHEIVPADVLALARRRLGGRGSAQLPEVVALASALAESPMETRIRLALHFAGLPQPVLQHPGGPYRLDMAYPDLMVAVEYDGRHHLDADQALYDLHRATYLGRCGWIVLRFRTAAVLGRPWWIASVVRDALRRAAQERGLRAV